MTNHFAAYTVPVPGGHWGMCRFAHNAKPWPILDGNKPKVFPRETDALIAAQGNVIKHINGTLRRDGETIAICKADAAFPGLDPFVRNKAGKRVPVERKARKGGERVSA